MADPIVYVTLLPCGTDGGKLKFSAILTPALEDGADVPPVFQDWPTNSAPLMGQWTLQIKSGAATATAMTNPVTPKPDPDLWKAFIAGSRHSDGKIPVRKRKRADALKNAWLLSHDAHYLHQRHQDHRTYHVVRQLVSSINPADSTLPDLSQSIDATAPRNVYIYPVIQSGGNGVSMPKMIADRNMALAFKQAHFSPTTSLLADIRRRIDHGQQQLEASEGEQLTGLALMALFKICAESAHRQDEAGVAALVSAIKSGVGDLNTNDPALFDEVQRYVGFHLFKNRSQKTCGVPPPPDFHQLLGLLNQYPALLRPLGLVFDFSGVSLTGSVPAGQVTASLKPPDGLSAVSPQSLDTVCTSVAEFSAASRPSLNPADPLQPHESLHSGRFLRLGLSAGGSPLFSLVTEDTDGSSHKLTQQTAAAARSKEYAPSAKPVNNGLGLPNTAEHVPSSRTAGLALYYVDRANTLADAVQSTPASTVTTRPPLFIEDLTLGYRVDVQNVTPGSPWMSLHERKSTYKIHGKAWPLDKTAFAADEGFITLAATQTPVDPTAANGPPDTGENLQVQVHQSLMSWTGWSLSVPRPKSKSDDPMKKGKPPDSCASNTPKMPVEAVYTLKPGGSLPKLRFDETYAVRLRQVDLAGNSVPVEAGTADGAALKMESPFSRHEPLRAPQILVETPIDHSRQPSEHADRMVLRDKSADTSRILVPPREPLRMAELHGFADDSSLPQSAFPDLQLTSKGSFPSVAEASHEGWITTKFDKSAENQDALFLPLKSSRPEKAYYPDPIARFVRVEPLVLQQDLSTYVPWRSDQDVIDSKIDGEASSYLDFQWLDKWPLVSPIRIVARAATADKPLRFRQDWMPQKEPGTLPSIPVLYVDVPAGWTVALRLTSAACIQPHPPDTRLRLEANLQINAPSGKGKPISALPRGAAVNLFHSYDKMFKAPAPAPLAIAVAAGGVGPMALLAQTAAVPLPAPPPAPATLSERLANVLNTVSPQTFVCGSTHYVTPPRILTLVHALRQPLYAPNFSGDENGSNFKVVRDAGTTAAKVTTKFLAHWLSTAKITCRGSWTDRIDDPTKPTQQVRTSDEIAFEFLNSGMPEPSGKAKATERAASAAHQFRDTRAHRVIYSFSAFSRFNEYYPEKPGTLGLFTKAGDRTCTVDVLSSVRPPAPSIAYVVPAFAWQDAWEAKTKSWKRGRTMVLRVYLHRPFLVSGDEECLGVVLGTAGSGRAPVTEWGRDPVVLSDFPLPSNLMAASDFAGGVPVSGCTLSEGGTADILPFPVEFSEDRGLWFCDIPFSPSRTASAFARLALVRWQPKAILQPEDARLSQVVLADFMQVGPDRWVSVKKVSSKQYSVAVSGVFRTPATDPNTNKETKEHTISCSAEQRWHRLGSDMGWRPACPGPMFAYQKPQNGSPVSSWSATVDLPHSSSIVKFRLLLEEHEWLPADVSKANTGAPTQKNKSRTTYLHYIDL